MFSFFDLVLFAILFVAGIFCGGALHAKPEGERGPTVKRIAVYQLIATGVISLMFGPSFIVWMLFAVSIMGTGMYVGYRRAASSAAKSAEQPPAPPQQGDS